MRLRGVLRPSVCKLLHLCRYFYHTHDSIATKLAHDGPHMVLHPGCAEGQGQRSRDTDTFLITQKSTSTTNMTRSPLNLHTIVPRWAYVQGVLKVKVKGHVI